MEGDWDSQEENQKIKHRYNRFASLIRKNIEEEGYY
jgi:hypothetical protein